MAELEDFGFQPANALVPLLVDLYTRPGYPFEKNVRAFDLARIDWEWRSGQWVMITGERGQLFGWQSWYRVTPEVLERIKAREYADLIRAGVASEQLLSGPIVYIATTVTTPYAPGGTYRRLYEATRDANPERDRICSWICKRNGKKWRWFERTKERDVSCHSENNPPLPAAAR